MKGKDVKNLRLILLEMGLEEDYKSRATFENDLLIKLNLASMKIAILPDSIRHLTNLEQLNLSKNQLKSLPDGICDLVNLTHLYLTENPLLSLPERMVKLSKLKSLYIQNTMLTIKNLEILKKLPNTGCFTFSCLGNNFQRDGKLEDAVLAYKEVVKIDPGYSGSSDLYFLGNNLNSLGRYEEALEYLINADNFQRYKIAALISLGFAYFSLNRFDEAEIAFLRAKEKDEKGYYRNLIFVNLSSSYIKQGEFDKALDLIQGGLDKDPDNGNLHYNLACLYAKMNEIDKTLNSIKDAIEWESEFLEGINKDSDFSDIRSDKRFQALLLMDRETIGEYKGSPLHKREISILKELDRLVKESSRIKKTKPGFEYSIRGNRITKLRLRGLSIFPECIGGLFQLTRLRCNENNQIPSLPDTMKKLTKLRFLWLDDNLLISLPEWIGELSKLESLDISRNRLTSLPNSLIKLTKLKNLNLNNNRITAKPRLLQDLEEQGCKVRFFQHYGAYLNPDDTKALELLEESIGYIPQNGNSESPSWYKVKKKKLIELKLSGFHSLPKTLGKFKNLQILRVSGRKLEKLPYSIGNLESLQELDLSASGIKSFPKSIKKLSTLKHLDLSKNGYDTIPDSIGYFSSLTHLCLKSNNLVELPDAIGNQTNLEELILSENYLKKLPEAIGNLSNLKILDLNNNKLRSFPEPILELRSLTTLNLENNHIRKIPESIGRLTNLQAIWLKGNFKMKGRISYLPEFVIKIILDLTMDSDENIQERAVNTIYDIKKVIPQKHHLSIDRSILDPLLDQTNSKKKTLQLRAVERLRTLGKKATSKYREIIINRLLKLLKKPDVELCQKVVQELGQFENEIPTNLRGNIVISLLYLCREEKLQECAGENLHRLSKHWNLGKAIPIDKRSEIADLVLELDKKEAIYVIEYDDDEYSDWDWGGNEYNWKSHPPMPTTYKESILPAFEDLI